MKYVLFSVLIILIGCAHTTNNVETLESSSVDFDVAAGMYERFNLNSLKVGSDECVEFVLKKPYGTTKWAAALMLYIVGDSKKETSKIALYTEQHDSKSLTLAYMGSDNKYQVIKKNINFGEPVKFNASFENNRTVGFKLAYSEFLFPLEYKIDSVLVGASSSQATVRILEKSECSSPK